MIEQPPIPDVPRPPDSIGHPHPSTVPTPPEDPSAEQPDRDPVPPPTDPGPAVL